MTHEELHELLAATDDDAAIISTYWRQSGLSERFSQLEARSNDPNFWQDPEQTEILKELQRIRVLKDQHEHMVAARKELRELIELFANDPQEFAKLRSEIISLTKTIRTLKITLLLNDPQDISNCFLSINAGAGGTESQDWADMLLRMYTRFCERAGFSISVVDYQVGEEAGIKSATLFVRAKNAYGFLKSEQGIHRLVRISPFDANKRRHTSFAAIAIVAEVPEVEVTVDPNDLRIDTYRAGGAGGQHVNKTDSAVRITHIPTGIVVQCQNERSQTQNKETALKMLKAKLAQKQKEETDAALAAVEKKKIEWGSQIRSYVLHPYKMVKDHRTEVESPQPDLVLDGELMEFIESYLVWQTTVQK